jgi:hypothetical protein
VWYAPPLTVTWGKREKLAEAVVGVVTKSAPPKSMALLWPAKDETRPPRTGRTRTPKTDPFALRRVRCKLPRPAGL